MRVARSTAPPHYRTCLVQVGKDRCQCVFVAFMVNIFDLGKNGKKVKKIQIWFKAYLNLLNSMKDKHVILMKCIRKDHRIRMGA